jgi:hypothetical protein
MCVIIYEGSPFFKIIQITVPLQHLKPDPYSENADPTKWTNNVSTHPDLTWYNYFFNLSSCRGSRVHWQESGFIKSSMKISAPGKKSAVINVFC